MLIEEIKKDEWPKNPIDSSRIQNSGATLKDRSSNNNFGSEIKEFNRFGFRLRHESSNRKDNQ